MPSTPAPPEITPPATIIPPRRPRARRGWGGGGGFQGACRRPPHPPIAARWVPPSPPFRAERDSNGRRGASASVQPQIGDVLRVGLQLADLDPPDDVGQDRVGRGGAAALLAPAPANTRPELGA